MSRTEEIKSEILRYLTVSNFPLTRYDMLRVCKVKTDLDLILVNKVVGKLVRKGILIKNMKTVMIQVYELADKSLRKKKRKETIQPNGVEELNKEWRNLDEDSYD